MYPSKTGFVPVSWSTPSDYKKCKISLSLKFAFKELFVNGWVAKRNTSFGGSNPADQEIKLMDCKSKVAVYKKNLQKQIDETYLCSRKLGVYIEECAMSG